MAIANSVRLNRQMLRRASTWISPVTAISTTAARTGCGSVRSSPVKKSTTPSVMSGGHQPRERASRAGRLVDKRLRHAAAHRQSAAEAGHQIGAADSQEFLRGVEPIAVLGAEHAADGRRFNRREHEARHRQGHDLADVRDADHGQPRHRQALRNFAEQRHATAVQVQYARGDDAADHDEERHRTMFQQGLAEQQEHQRDDPQCQGCRVRVAQATEEMAHTLPEIAVAAAEPEQLRQLRARREIAPRRT